MLFSYFTVNIVIDLDDRLELKDSPTDKGKEVFELLLKDKKTNPLQLVVQIVNNL